MIVDPEKYIQNGLKVVSDLEKQGNVPAALRACEELLRVNPYHLKVQKYIQHLQETIVSQNAAKVDKDIDATMHLWDEHRYDDLATIYTRLYQFAPQHQRLKKMIEKLQHSMTDAQKNTYKDFLQKAYDAISQLIREEKWSDAIQASNELLQRAPGDAKSEKLLLEAKNGYVEGQLEKNRNVIEGSDFERAVNLYQQLLAIYPEHTRTRRLLQQTQSHLSEKKILASKINLNESIARMKELFKTNEYEKVIQACDEILQLDAHCVTAQVFRKKAEATLEKECTLLEVRALKARQSDVAADKTAHPDNYINV
ncbi:hypothetical protein KBD59_04405 [Candidatus Gracilibacteria bacterium]|nr:hypothetical protein [Candidatus Gracilibacteria bacterium]